jgi:hypothetical protein
VDSLAPKADLPRISDRLGAKAGPHREAVPAARIAAFYRAIGVSPRAEAPPSFMTICRKGEFELFDQLVIPLSRVLHAEQEYTFEEPIRGGDEIVYSSELVQALEKRGSRGQMLFMTVETEVTIERQGKSLKAGTTRSTVVVK